MQHTPTVTIDDVRAAATLLGDVALTTPIEVSRSLSAMTDVPVLLKCEHLQRAGSFKIRGAYVRIANLSEEERARGVVAASAGNHAQGVALAASLLGTKSTVFMPEGAPIPKEKATRAYGADIRFTGESVDDCLVAATEFAEATGAVLIHPFDHVDIVAGQATVGLEIVEQVPDVATVIVPVGGGGLAAGIASAIGELRPDVRVVGVQAERVAAYPESLRAGHPVAVPGRTTMADGIAVRRPGDVPFAAISANVDEILTVSEEALSRAMLLLLERAKQLVEPAGAAAVAALLDNRDKFEGPVVCVLSGGNVDPLLLIHLLRHGMAAAGRYFAFRARIPDRPGGLRELLDLLAKMDVNVLDVVHERTSAALHLDEVEVSMQVETRGPEHRERVETELTQAGYTLSF
ncbi:threonine ammonia-lyase [Solicola gregarius]|uniref:threonine ammonia-lyase n=1 Tax=Solicola gregarius TaxID=2908642 RepID=A0AA46TJG9_9ACTN|nr:threonine ammonia-lyase [Solicola gregarius]UYM06396.1 threonine ammonia-lyase [Solicola gregarius]